MDCVILWKMMKIIKFRIDQTVYTIRENNELIRSFITSHNRNLFYKNYYKMEFNGFGAIHKLHIMTV